ncbi:alpha/beta fold hydrolase [Aspergillus ibericus CBS 121593]|uniref:AB hydrolase-1 domain-containing protein n=1 Tax=Aspergillus ibericus CBS 121593 TaxID=1448316 RepID=A0A395H5S0_9EURO|nr:hypothetical protein BO80DRAFT_433009 [Aspergillus ibericus CBS 121593]RAL03232.1 hypothetical protein BO80DRAFT_433009 [Aspergillus ibericus CBS 121593]
MQSTTSNTKHNHIRSHLPLPSNTNTTSTAETKIDTLYHETLGTGPPLLLIPGAHSTGLIYTNLAQQLSRYFRVTLYDLRGFARSFSSSSVRTTLQTHIDDAKTLIHHITASPTPDPKKPNKKRYRSIHIFSSSSSASIALSLLKNPDIHIKNLILHEPVLPTLLPRPYLTHIQTQLQLHVFSPARPCMAEINRHLVSMTQTREGWEDFKRTDAYKAIERFPGDYSLGFFGDVLPDVLEWEVDVGMVREWMGGEGHGGGGKLALGCTGAGYDSLLDS